MGNTVVLQETRRFEAEGGLFQIPRIEKGEESFDFDIPEGLQLSLVDLSTPDLAVGSGAEIIERAPRGATGRVRITVGWTHPVPVGKVTFLLKVYASPDGTPPMVVTPLTEPASHARMKMLIEQDADVQMTIDGPLAETFKTQVLDRGAQLVSPDLDRFARTQVAGADDALIFLGITLALIAAVCIVLGFATFGAVLIIAMQKGYNIEDASYGVAVGEGKSRQEHNMRFNIMKP